MVKYVDKNVWVEQVLMPDESTPILGGTPDWDENNMLAGWSNVPAGQLADRTRFLKEKVEELEQEIETGGSSALQKDNNLSDLQDVGQAKFNLGLNLVDNTRDLDKPVSDLTQEALDEKVDKEAGKGLSSNDFTTVEKNKLSGIQAGAQVNVATDLSVGTRTATSVQVTSSTGSTATLPAATDTLAGVMSAADKQKLDGISAGAGVTSVAGKTGVVTLTKADVSLGNVDNTADSVKNVASASKLTTARTISATGDANWSVSFDGSGNSTAALTLTNSGAAAGTYTKVTVDAKGRVTTGAAMAASDIPALNATKANVLDGTNNLYVSGGTYLNVISWNDMGSLSANTSINLDTSLNHRLTAAASLTLDATNVDPGKTGDIVINTPTAVTVSWAAKWKFLGSVPNIGGAGETWVVSYKVFDANTIYAAAVKVA